MPKAEGENQMNSATPQKTVAVTLVHKDGHSTTHHGLSFLTQSGVLLFNGVNATVVVDQTAIDKVVIDCADYHIRSAEKTEHGNTLVKLERT